MTRKHRTPVAIALLAAISAFFSIVAQAAGTDERPFGLVTSDGQQSTDRSPQLFVRFDVPSVAEFCVAEHQRTGVIPDAAAQKAQAARVDAQQAALRGALEALGAEVVGSLRVGANGVRVEVSAQNAAALKQLPGVVSVAPVTEHFIDNAQSVPWIGAPAVWAAVGTGEGVSIGVIDTGVDYTHANFGGPGTPADYSGNDPDVIEAGTFPTAKVVGGFDFAGTNYNAGDPANSTPIPDDDPLDENGHGSHVSGTATGLGVAGIIGPGVAPGADLYALKVFGVSGSTNVTSEAIEWAMDPNGDGDTSDHLDVINMSLGSTFGHPDDPSAITTQNAVDLGIIVATSAGNSSDVSYVTGSPGVAVGAISTAASTKGGDVLGIEVGGDVTDTIEAIEGTSPVQLISGAVMGALAQPSAANIFGCNAIPAGSMANSIALISRGACSFNAKFVNAQAAGAVGVVVYNDGANPGRIAPIVMGGISGGTVPGVMIPSTDGMFLSTQLTGGASISAVLDVNITTPTDFADLIAGFSSRGPSQGGSGFKPDVTNPGVAVISTGIGSGNGPATNQGTSMASPHTAGVGALLRQQHPSLSPVVIKAIIQNSTVDMNPLNGPIVGGVLQLTRQGVGRVSAENAMNLGSYASPGGVSFGRVNPTFFGFERRRVRLVSLGGSRQFNVTHVPNQTFPGVTVTCPDSVHVPAHGKRNVRIELHMDPSVGPFDAGNFTQTEVDGWCVFDDGIDTLRVGYIAVVDPASLLAAQRYGRSFVHVKNFGAGTGSAEGFTQTGGEGDVLDDVSHAIRATGFRTADPALFGGDVMELAVVTERPWDAMRDHRFDYFIDVDSDGIADFQLSGVNWGAFPGGVNGTMVTAQFALPSGAGFLDWLVTLGDFNDNSVVLPFSKEAFGGFVPRKFDYLLVTTNRDGTQDTQSGSVDTAEEIVPDLNSFLLETFGEATVDTTSASGGRMLWLFQQNRARQQHRSVRVRANP